MLILISPIVTASIFGIEYDAVNWILIGLPFVSIYLASGAIHELAMKMPRTGAQYVPLLSLVLIWPLLIANDAVATSDFWTPMMLATGISLIIWFGLPILHPRTTSN